jgi:hypothetical protein
MAHRRKPACCRRRAAFNEPLQICSSQPASFVPLDHAVLGAPHERSGVFSASPGGFDDSPAAGEDRPVLGDSGRRHQTEQLSSTT